MPEQFSKEYCNAIFVPDNIMELCNSVPHLYMVSSIYVYLLKVCTSCICSERIS